MLSRPDLLKGVVMNIKNIKNKDMDYEAVISAIRSSSRESSIYVGADSKQFTRSGGHYVAYVAVVVIHIDSKSGCKIFREHRIERDYGQLRLRLMNEVYMAGEIAMQIVEHIEDRPFEIHLDLNPSPSHASNVCVKEAAGYVVGTLGIQPKLKPDAFAASAVSDRWAVKDAENRRNRRHKRKLKVAV